MLDLDAIESRCNAAAPPPWEYVGSPWNHFVRLINSGDSIGPFGNGKNAKFIARAREDVPALIARVRELEGIIRADQERLTQAALRVGLHWGCDTPDAMADAIQEWQAETYTARKRVGELEAALSEQSEIVQRDWLSTAEKEGWLQELQQLRDALQGVYDSVGHISTIPGPVGAKIMRALGKAE